MVAWGRGRAAARAGTTAVAALACLALAGCGGGGSSGGSDGGPGPSTPPPPVSPLPTPQPVPSPTPTPTPTPAPAPAPAPTPGLSLDQTALSWDIEEAEPLDAQVITGAINGATEPVFLFVEYTDTAVGMAQFELTGPTTGRLNVYPRPWEALQPGSYRDTVTVRACFDNPCTRPVAGSPKTIEVRYTLRAAAPAPALMLSQYGVAFAAAPHGQRLTQTLTVLDSSSDTSHWTASSDASWLRVTPTGTVGTGPTLAADARGLAAGQYLANVTVRSDNARIAQPQTVAVGLYVTQAARATVLAQHPLASDTSNGVPRDTVVVDPVRPVLYSAAFGQVFARHFYTGEVLASWPLGALAPSGIVQGRVLSLAISDDGRELYALEQDSRSVHVIDLRRNRIDRSFGVADLGGLFNSFNDGRLAFLRLNGRGLLLANDGPANTIGVSTLLDPQTGTRTAALGLPGAGLHLLDPVSSQDGRYVYAARGNAPQMELVQVRPAVNSKGTIFSRVTTQAAGNGRLQANPGGGFVDGLDQWRSAGNALVSAPSPIRDALAALTFQGAYEFALGSDGRMLIATEATSNSVGADIWLFRADGSLQKRWVDSSFSNQAFMPRSPSALALRISSDGLRAQNDFKLVDLPN